MNDCCLFDYLFSRFNYYSLNKLFNFCIKDGFYSHICQSPLDPVVACLYIHSATASLFLTVEYYFKSNRFIFRTYLFNKAFYSAN